MIPCGFNHVEDDKNIHNQPLDNPEDKVNSYMRLLNDLRLCILNKQKNPQNILHLIFVSYIFQILLTHSPD